MKTEVHLQRDVMDELDWEPTVDAAHIGVTVNEGVVTLTGHVPVYAEKQTAEEVVRRVRGVRAVANEIEVRPTDEHRRDDEDIATAALHALVWDVQVPDEDLQLVVTDGRIKVDGRVQHAYQKAAVDRVLRHLQGAREVTNAIRVEPPEALAELKVSIEAAWRRSAALNARQLEAEVEGNTVTLTGDVHSPAELEEALRTAWSACGVRHVQNCITVTPWGFGPAEEWGY